MKPSFAFSVLVKFVDISITGPILTYPAPPGQFIIGAKLFPGTPGLEKNNVPQK